MTNRYYRRSRISEARFRRLLKLFALDLSASDAARVRGRRSRGRRGILAPKQKLPFSGETTAGVATKRGVEAGRLTWRYHRRVIDFPLCPARPLEEEVRRAAGSLLDDALVRLSNENDLDKTVHESRKRLKETRALLRLVRFSLVNEKGKPFRSRENDALRDAGGLLSGARDAAVAIETVTNLRSQFPDKLSADAFEPLVKRLKDRCDQLASETAGTPTDEALDAIRAVRERIDGWRLKSNGWKAMAEGLHKIYADGREDFKRLCDAKGLPDDPEMWHDWRKRVKDLRYAFELLMPAHEDLLGAMRTVAKQLTDWLGDDHDLAELSRLLTSDDESFAKADSSTVGVEAAILALIDRRRTELQTNALRTGRLLYAEKPKAFVRRLGTYWTVAAS